MLLHLCAIGLIATIGLIIYSRATSDNDTRVDYGTWAAYACLASILLFGLAGIRLVPDGYSGIQTQGGKVLTAEYLKPGIQWIAPWTYVVYWPSTSQELVAKWSTSEYKEGSRLYSVNLVIKYEATQQVDQIASELVYNGSVMEPDGGWKPLASEFEKEVTRLATEYYDESSELRLADYQNQSAWDEYLFQVYDHIGVGLLSKFGRIVRVESIDAEVDCTQTMMLTIGGDL
ncbi:MAG: hypothetical protein R3B38_00785 [Patescibacteria group bacterium]